MVVLGDEIFYWRGISEDRNDEIFGFMIWLAETCLDAMIDGNDINADIKQFFKSHCIWCRLMGPESGYIADFLLLKKAIWKAVAELGR
jgi:hypothetical protein